MPTQPYKNKAGQRLPGVTTILSRFKEAGGLVHWAWDLGRQGIDYRQVRDDAANAGTAAHLMVESDIRGIPFDRTPYSPELLERADSAFDAYRQWRDQTKLEPVATELSLVSEVHQFGGTMDLMLTNGRLTLGDIKTSARLYPEHLIQVAAYAILWEEHHPDQPVQGFHILRFAKEHADFSHHHFANLDGAREAFLNMRRLYDLCAELKKRAA